MKNQYPERFFKVLDKNGMSAHGGKMDWKPYLPVYNWNDDFSYGYWRAGNWVEHSGHLKMCSNGFHLTASPLKWLIPHGRVFIAEYDGEFISDNSDKGCFRRVRLIAELGTDTSHDTVKLFKLLSRGADLRRADLSGADLRGEDLSGVDLNGADLSEVDLRGADLNGAYLRGVNLSGVDLSEVNLRRADLRGADLNGADLRGADLRGADLRGADLRGADLRGEDLRGANLRGAYFYCDPEITGYVYKNGRLWEAA